jgi:hypothetical protein
MFDLYRIQYAQNILNITSAVRGVTETGEAKKMSYFWYTQILILQNNYDYYSVQTMKSI